MTKKYVLFLMLCGLYAGAMDVAPKLIKKKDNVGKYEPLVEDISHKIILKTKSAEGVVSDKHILFDKNILSSVLQLKMLWKRRPDKNEYVIFVSDGFYLDAYEFVLHIVDLFVSHKPDKIARINQELKGLESLDELIEVINCAYFLQVNDKVLKFFVPKIIDWIKKSDFLKQYRKLFSLNTDFGREYVSPQIMPDIISYLKAITIKKYGTTDIFSRNTYLMAKHQAYFFNNNQNVQSSLMLISDGDSNGCDIYDVITTRFVRHLNVIKRATIYATCGNNLVAAGCDNNDFSAIIAQRPEDKKLIVWNLDKNDQKNVKSYEFTDRMNYIQDIAFSPSGKYLISVGNKISVKSGGSRDLIQYIINRISVWNTDNIPWDADLSQYQMPCTIFKHTLDRVIKVDLPSDNEFLVLGFQDKSIKLMRVVMNDSTDKLQFKSEEIVSHEGILATTRVTARNSQTTTYDKRFDSYTHVVFSFDHKKAALLLYGNEECNNSDDAYKIIIFDIANGTSIEKQFSIKKDGKISSIAFDSDSRWLVCSKLNNKEICIYDAVSGDFLLAITGLYYGNHVVRLSADGSKMVLLSNASVQLGYKPSFEPFGNCKVKELLTNSQLEAFNDLKAIKDFHEVLTIYVVCQQLKESNNGSLMSNVPVLSENDDLFAGLPEKSKELLEYIGLTQQAPKKTWRQWFAQRSWKEIFGAAVAVGIGYEAYKYMNQQK